MKSTVDKNAVAQPKVYFTQEAFNQLSLIIDNDFTLAGKYFRLLISGKGCDGFEYSAGFTDLHDDDLLVPVTLTDKQATITEQHIVMDPFTAFYLQLTHVDFVQDFEHNNEGFVITNKNQKSFNGKFWKQNQELVPPTLS